LTSKNPPNFCNTTSQSLRPKNGVTFFRTAALDTTEGAALANYLFRQQHYTTAYIIEDTGIYGQDFAQGFKDEWSKITNIAPLEQPLPTDTTPSGYQGVINQFKPTDPTHSVIFYAGNTPNATLIYALIEQDTQLQGTAFAAGAGIINASFATDIGGAQQSGPIYAVAPVGRSNSQHITDNLDFYSSYLSTYNDQPTLYSASAYDCTNMVINAIAEAINGTVPGIPTAIAPPTGPGDSTQAQTFRNAIIEAMRHISYDGITDHYTFTASGDTNNQTFSLYQLDIQSQHWKYISTNRNGT
jgi:branched-chain amino acid transport system substrate-binding protein